MKLKVIKTRDFFFLQCNELNRGHPKFFSQSQDEFRTKESEFVHFRLTGWEVSGQLAYLQTRLRQLAYAYGELAYVGEFDHLRRRVWSPT